MSGYSYPLTSSVYTYTGTLVNLTPLRIGTGGGQANEIDLKIIYSNGRPYMPGSSIKGVLRTQAERYVLLNGAGKYTVHDPNNLTSIVRDKKDLEKIADCPTCLLFGAPGLASRLTVIDAYARNGYRVSYRTMVSINRITGAQQKKALYTVEYVEPGAAFDFRMSVVGIKDTDDGTVEAFMGKIVKYLVDTMQGGELQFGSKKSSGFGVVQLKDVNLVVR